MTEYVIYQINHDRDKNRVKFWDYNFTMAEVGHIDYSIYDKVYDGVSDKVKTLDDIFSMFNASLTPKGFTGHSLSVSDIVEIFSTDSTEMEPGMYFCNVIGWVKVD